jgi:hypothetical protein
MKPKIEKEGTSMTIRPEYRKKLEKIGKGHAIGVKVEFLIDFYNDNKDKVN